MKKIFTPLICINLFLFSCSSKQGKKEETVTAPTSVETSDSTTLNEVTDRLSYAEGDEVPKSVLWQNLLFKLSREEMERLEGNVDGILVPGASSKNLEDMEILIIDENGKVLKKIFVGKDGSFSFKKLPIGNTTFLLAEKDAEVKAKLMAMVDDATGPSVNSKADQSYIIKNLFKKLSKEDFIAEFNTIEISLSGVPQKNMDNLTLIIVDEGGKVIEKIVANKRSKFIFQKLSRGNYSVLIHNGHKNIQANIRVLVDDSKLPLEANADQNHFAEPEMNSFPNKAYIQKHTLKKLTRDEFTKKFATVQVNLQSEGKQLWDNMVMVILDEDGKVIEKMVSNGKDYFLFEKLSQGEYTFLLHNKPDNVHAEIRIISDEPLVVAPETKVEKVEAPVEKAPEPSHVAKVPEPHVVKEIPGEAEYKEGMSEYYKFNFSKALEHFHQAEKKDNPEVFYMLGRMYDSGEGVAVNNEKALHYYEKGVSHGDVKANAGLAVLYNDGKGVPIDSIKAKGLFRKALPAIQEKAKEGNLFWMTRLGTLYNFGYGVKEDYTEASKWYTKASDQGYAFAQFNLGVMYENGLGVKQDYATALKLYQKAVDQGDVDAEFKMGVMYANGFGVTRDYAQALKWYTKAANYGYADAQYNIGVMHANGLGGEKNYEEAIKWYRKAADQGFADAEYNLGVMYAKGQGVKKDNDEAVKWYKLAAKQGVEEAQKLLKKKGIEW